MDSRTLEFEGRALRWHDSGPSDAELTVYWHHGTPNTGEAPPPLVVAGAERGIRFISHNRPGYPGSDRVVTRSVFDVTRDVTAVAEAAGVSRFAVLGHSGGVPHALACAVQIEDAVPAVAAIAGVAPLTGLKQGWWDGMHPLGLKELRAAVRGEQAVRRVLERREYDPRMFPQSDHDALAGKWGWFNDIVAGALADGIDGMVLDNLAVVGRWGFAVEEVRLPTLVVHGTADRIVPVHHGRWLADTIRGSEYEEREGDGHISVMDAGVAALDWLLQRSREDIRQ